MRTNFTSDTYSKGQREGTPGVRAGERVHLCRFYSCSKSPLSRGPARNKNRKRGGGGACLVPLTSSSFFFLSFFLIPLLFSLSPPPASNRYTDLWFRPITCPLIQLNTRYAPFPPSFPSTAITYSSWRNTLRGIVLPLTCALAMKSSGESRRLLGKERRRFSRREFKGN